MPSCLCLCRTGYHFAVVKLGLCGAMPGSVSAATLGLGHVDKRLSVVGKVTSSPLRSARVATKWIARSSSPLLLTPARYSSQAIYAPCPISSYMICTG